MPSSRTASYAIIEPHPTATPTSYIATGRGGAGNITRAPANLTKGASAQGPPSRIQLSSFSGASTSSAASTSSRGHSNAFHSGRGGVGNVHPATERAIFSFDEELERQLSQERHAAPVYHVGRGGAGNVSGTSAYPKTAARKTSHSDSSSEKSVGSVESGADAATRVMKGAFKRVFH